MLRREQIGGESNAFFMADIHKLTSNEPQGNNAGSLRTHAAWATAEQEVKKLCCLSLCNIFEIISSHWLVC